MIRNLSTPLSKEISVKEALGLMSDKGPSCAKEVISEEEIRVMRKYADEVLSVANKALNNHSNENE